MSKKSKKDLTKELAQELDVFDEMFSTLIELLEEKRIITQNEFEARLKAKIAKAERKESYRDVQFIK
jgi:hypothetical protein